MIIYFFLYFFFFSNFIDNFSSFIFFFFTKKKTKNIRRKSLYECGFESFGDSHVLINIQFITIALLFVIFDLEILFIVPWVVSASFLGVLGYFTIYFILNFFSFGFIYEWFLGALSWKKNAN